MSTHSSPQKETFRYPAMKRKPIRIDWDELEQAFDNKRDDLVYYLDLVTGQVVLEGEGEETVPDERDDPMDEAAERSASPREPSSHKLYVERPADEEEMSWMDDFVAEAADLHDDVRAELEAALGREDAEAFREALRPHPGARDRWFLYRSERLHETIDAWLDAHHVHPVAGPPWR